MLFAKMGGRLYIVSTPIGNLGDITVRALEVLKEVNIIACEDTRVTKKLLSHYGITKRLVSYHEHNERERAGELLSVLREGNSLALVSDAGTPGVSDPGYRLVRLASEEGIEILSIPGASAVVSALSVSGLPTASFAFFGFPPRTKKALTVFLERISSYPETLIFYESPKRVIKTLAVMSEVFGDRNISLSRELTKLYEETLRGRITQVIEILKERKAVKGEIVIVVEGSSGKTDEREIDAIDKSLESFRNQGVSLKEAVSIVSEQSGYSKSKTYKRALKVWGK